MNLKIVISRRAELDMTRQYRWCLETASVTVAENYLAAVDASIRRLATIPALGRCRRFRASELAGIRSKTADRPFGVHLVFYRYDKEQLSIEREMHGARDLGRRLVEE